MISRYKMTVSNQISQFIYKGLYLFKILIVELIPLEGLKQIQVFVLFYSQSFSGFFCPNITFPLLNLLAKKSVHRSHANFTVWSSIRETNMNIPSFTESFKNSVRFQIIWMKIDRPAVSFSTFCLQTQQFLTKQN